MNGIGAVVAPPAMPSAAVQAQDWKAAQDFEAQAIGQMLQPMFATVDLSGTPFGGGEAEQSWQQMMVTQMGRQVQRAGGIGIAQPVYREMLRMQEAAKGGNGVGRVAS